MCVLCYTVWCVAAVALSSASADLFGEDEDTREQLRNLTMEGSDEVVKSKPNPTHRDSPRTGNREASTARAQLSMLKEKSEDLEVDIVSREKVEEKESYIQYQVAVKVGVVGIKSGKIFL